MCSMDSNRRIINFIFNSGGNTGKSLLSEFLELNPKFNAIVAPQLSNVERYNSALIDQFEQYYSRHRKYPKVLIFDFSRNESNSNIESIYSTMENIKNGKIDSTFFGKYRRLKFDPPHVFVFTNAVPNLNALSRDRFNLLVITDSTYSYIALKCNVYLEIQKYKRGLVSWLYNAEPQPYNKQLEFYSSLENKELYKSLTISYNENGGALNSECYASATRTAPLQKTPESVQHEMLTYSNKEE